MKALSTNTMSFPKKKFLIPIIILALCFPPFFIARVWATEYTTTQITNNNYRDYGSQIHNGQVVWYGYDGNDYEIFLYDGTQIIKLTNNSYDDSSPQIHNGQVVWHGWDGDDEEIFLYDGTRTNQLTDNDQPDRHPQIHNGQLTWMGREIHLYDYYGIIYEYEIFLYDGTRTTKLTNNYYEDRHPQIHNGQVTWYGYDGNDDEIFLYDGTRTIKLTDNNYYDAYPQIHNGQVVWYGYDGNDYEIFLYDGTRINQLTDNNYYDAYPQIHNGQVVWRGYDGNDYEIFLYDGTQIIKLTNNNYSDGNPQIHNGQVVWRGYDGNDYEIFLYDGTQITQLTNNSYDDYVPQIHNGQVTWFGYDGNDYEIFLATPERKVEIVLTFDDGPVGDIALGSGNYTESILNDLYINDVQNDIKGAFFVQTHAPKAGGSLIGEELIVREDFEDHVIAVHTGGKGKHKRSDYHWKRARKWEPWFLYDANEDGVIDEQDGQNALECDLIAAKKRIYGLTGKVPEFVRPPYYEYGKTQEDRQRVLVTYQSQGLKMILADAKGQEGGNSLYSFGWWAVVRLRDTIEEAIKNQGINQIVITLHDTNEDVAENFISPKFLFHSSILDAIIEGVRRGLELETREEALESTQFITSGEEIRQILNSKEW